MESMTKPINNIHIITSNRKWGVYNLNESYRSKRNFKYRDLAFHYAANKYKAKIIVHNSDGGVDFVHDNN